MTVLPPDMSRLRDRFRADVGLVTVFACLFAGGIGAAFLQAGELDRAGVAAAVAALLVLGGLGARGWRWWTARRVQERVQGGSAASSVARRPPGTA